MNVVSRTIITAMPSTPSVKRMPHDGIHAQSTTDCQPAIAGSKLHQSPSETTNSTANVTQREHARRAGRAGRDFVLGRGRIVRRPCTQIATAPSSGMSRSAGRIQLLVADGRQKGVHEFG